MRMCCAVLAFVFISDLPNGRLVISSESRLYNVAQTSLGATPKGTGSPFNKDWPANNAIGPEGCRAGTIFGGPLKGGRVDIRLVIPVDIQAIEVAGLDYHGTMVPKAIDIFIEGRVAEARALLKRWGAEARIALIPAFSSAGAAKPQPPVATPAPAAGIALQSFPDAGLAFRLYDLAEEKLVARGDVEKNLAVDAPRGARHLFPLVRHHE